MDKVLFTVLMLSLPISIAFSQDIVTLQPGPDEGKDAQLWSYDPNLNLGDSPVFGAMGWTFSGGNHGKHRAIVDFDLSVIPSEARITEAVLYLYYYSHPPNNLPHTGENQGYLKLIKTHWDEESVTWNSQPITTTDSMVHVPASIDPEQDYEIDVTPLIRQTHQHPGAYFGMMLHLEDETPYNCLMFGSSDNPDPMLRPKLVVTYDICSLPSTEFTYDVVDDKVVFHNETDSASIWWWDFGDGYYSSLENPEHSYESFGDYFVCLTAENECGSDTYCDTVLYCPGPVARFNYVVDGRTVFFADSSLMANAYLWDFGNGFYSNHKDPVYTYEEDGTYEVCLEVENECGITTICDSVTVTSLGTEDLREDAIKVFPNPARDVVTIEIPDRGEYCVCLLNSLGVKLLEMPSASTSADKIMMDIRSFPEGLYFLRLSVMHQTYSRKLIISR